MVQFTRRNKKESVMFKRIAVITAITILMACTLVVYAIEPVYISNKQGQRVDPGELNTRQHLWVVVNTVLSAGDEPTDLAVTERTYQTVVTAIAADVGGDGKIEAYSVPSTWNAARFRCIGITDNGTATFQVYGGTRNTRSTTTDCELAKLGQLAFVVGTQASVTSTYKLADAVTVTADTSWIADWGSVSPGSELVAEATIDLMGCDVLVIVPTTASANCKLLAKGY